MGKGVSFSRREFKDREAAMERPHFAMKPLFQSARIQGS